MCLFYAYAFERVNTRMPHMHVDVGGRQQVLFLLFSLAEDRVSLTVCLGLHVPGRLAGE